MSAIKHIPLLRYLNNQRITRQLIDTLPASVLSAVWEIALNIALGSVTQTQRESAYFKSKRQTLKKLSSKRVGNKTKKRLLTPLLLNHLIGFALRQLTHGNEDETGA